jgi:hypothetical protein
MRVITTTPDATTKDVIDLLRRPALVKKIQPTEPRD